MGGAAKKIGRAASGVFTLGGSEIARNNLKKSHFINKALQTPGMILTGGLSGGWSGGADNTADGSTGGFSLSQEEIDRNKGLIESEGARQYDQSIQGIAENQKAQELYAAEKFKQLLPQTAEDYNAGGLLSSTGYQQEVARQQADIAKELAFNAANARLGALSQKQGFQSSALNRAFGLEDFIRQANVAKTIGAQMAPQAPSGKSGALSGGAMGAAAGTPFGPWGAALGGLGGLILGGSQYRKGGK